jgi:hypothetical protein
MPPGKPIIVVISYLKGKISSLGDYKDHTGSLKSTGFLGERFYCGILPQQLPGPAQPAWPPGAEPQQAVSPGPGMACCRAPDMEEWAASSFLSPRPPHSGQAGFAVAELTRSSLVFPHSGQRKSKRGIIHLKLI